MAQNHSVVMHSFVHE